MFFCQKLKRIQEEKNLLAMRCELRRQLAILGVRSFWRDVRGSTSLVLVGISMAEHAIEYLRERKARR